MFKAFTEILGVKKQTKEASTETIYYCPPQMSTIKSIDHYIRFDSIEAGTNYKANKIDDILNYKRNFKT